MKTFNEFVNESLNPEWFDSLVHWQNRLDSLETEAEVRSQTMAIRITADALLGKPPAEAIRLFELGLLDEPHGDGLMDVRCIWNDTIRFEEDVEPEELAERFPDLFSESEDLGLTCVPGVKTRSWDCADPENPTYGAFSVSLLEGSLGSRAVVWETYDEDFYWMLKKDLM